MVQKQTNRANNTYLLHVSYSSPETMETCILPFWDRQDTELPKMGLKKINNTWEGGGDVFTTIDKWMTTFGNRVSECTGGPLLPPLNVGAEEPDTLSEIKSKGAFGISPHPEPISLHGGVLLGLPSDSLDNFWKSSDELHSPSGKLLFRRIGNNLQFWSRETSSSEGALAGRRYLGGTSS
jgi:hypothetical protein